MAINVVQPSSHGPEQIVSAAELIGKSKARALVFKAVYTGKSPVKMVAEISNATGLTRVRVLQMGKQLANRDIVSQETVDGLTGYRKVPFYQDNRDKILRLAKNRRARNKVPTMRNPVGSASSSKSLGRLRIDFRVQKTRIRAEPVSIDGIGSFAAVKKISRNQGYTRISETAFKNSIGAILGLRQEFKDWGGELRDLYDTGLRIRGKRHRAAFAFKGPGMSGTLVPGKMGKNGDQIQRLLKCPADVFLIQYWRDIGDNVMDQLQQLAELLSYQRDRRVYFGIIDGIDSTRLIKAYPKKFKVANGSGKR